MSKNQISFELSQHVWVAAICLLVPQLHMCVRGSLSEGAQNTELYLTRTKQAYNFLEDSLNALDGKTPVQENVKQRISTIDLATAHNALLKDLRFSKLKDIINIKKFVFEGIMQMVRERRVEWRRRAEEWTTNHPPAPLNCRFSPLPP
ncbi:conserved Plasmodium protein, unknown function [Plasmodium ovale wallikeri]|uniref:Uncharacterized protein n=1 Tax=Plasmodium ovale wallikeri TaxID=864142 RepID=A0A1A8YRZ6_PLAOA|nr:conserved Plasmodium protein, unknown function [Plasmodium ovale wallikeri]